ncbi:alpha/beta hydrolase [Bosea sp. Tri-44]|uniref:alpha/beta fold hydrolase n=1 Tax=Bosea sp. Tri-44 TaxID=1972137 RepID=UPI0013E951FC|nr:alpha/beta hydrolase [Bosea sp. Tri-44]
MRTFKLKNGDVSLECLNNEGHDGYPLVIIPGLSENIDDWTELAQFLYPRPVYAISLRGRGNSDAPPDAYSLDDHVSDVCTMIDQNLVSKFDLLGYSRGVSYALATLPTYRERIRRLILGDYPARHTRLPDGYQAAVASSIWRGRAMSERMPRHAIEGLQRSSRHIDLIDAVHDFPGEMLLLYGNVELGALLGTDDIKRYTSAKPSLKVRLFENSGHDLFSPDPLVVWRVISRFLEDASI